MQYYYKQYITPTILKNDFIYGKNVHNIVMSQIIFSEIFCTRVFLQGHRDAWLIKLIFDKGEVLSYASDCKNNLLSNFVHIYLIIYQNWYIYIYTWFIRSAHSSLVITVMGFSFPGKLVLNYEYFERLWCSLLYFKTKICNSLLRLSMV